VRAALVGPVDLSERPSRPRQSAVVVVLFEEGGETRVVLTRRTDSVRAHAGEVSFPGGRVEPAETLVAGALREASEEVGLDPGAVEMIGSLGRLTTVSSGSLISPFVAVSQGRPSLRVASSVEVARVFDVALADLAADGVYSSELWGASRAGSGSYREIHLFTLPGEIVWGATARMLVQMLSAILVA